MLAYLWSLIISIAWLLPNHYPPWTAFHADAWISVSFTPLIIISVTLSSKRVDWPDFALVSLLVFFIVWIQFLTGLIFFAQQVWMASAYLMGFILAIVAGHRWEKYRPNALSDILFFSFIIAAIFSVWLQWASWLNILNNEITDIWSMGLSGNRPYANLGQPNNLATLILMGMLGCFWIFNLGQIKSFVTILTIFFLITGLSLTQSRSGLLSATILLIGIWYWRRLWSSQWLPPIASFLYCWLLSFPYLLNWLSSILLVNDPINSQRIFQQGELRIKAWKLFFHAALEQPWFGFGLSDVARAQITVADKFEGLGATFGYTHNLFLDIVIWFGFPLGLIISSWIVWWTWKTLFSIKKSSQAIVFLTISVVALHAMVELPLYYAYFLLPVGFLIGIISVQISNKSFLTTSRWTLSSLAAACSLLLGVIISDYFKVEDSYNAWRFEVARIGINNKSIGHPPEVLVLTHLRDWIRLSRLDTTKPINKDSIHWVSRVTEFKPSAEGLYRLATIMARNGEYCPVIRILPVICKITDPYVCTVLQTAWKVEVFNSKLPPALNWPVDSSNHFYSDCSL